MELDEYIPILKDPISVDPRTLPLSPFTWRQALTQNRWGWAAYPNDQQKINIMLAAGKILEITSALYPLINPKVIIHSWLRVPQYNVFIGGARESEHLDGGAVDFSIEGANCDVLRERLRPQLTALKIRVENLPGTSWIHFGIKEPLNGVRYFKP